VTIPLPEFGLPRCLSKKCFQYTNSGEKIKHQNEITRKIARNCIYGGGKLSKNCPSRVKERQVVAEPSALYRPPTTPFGIVVSA
jgi:hypothetical protein